MIYQTFAQLYDQLFDPEMYEQWLDYTMREGVTRQNMSCLELAGGTGRLAVQLARNGLDMTVADISDEMLSLAMQHAENAGVNFQLVQADMRNLENFPQYQLVTCYADSLNYLESIKDVEATFKEVYAHLDVGGKFLFDMISPYKTDIEYPGFMYNYENDNEAFLWQSYANDEKEHGVIHELTFFICQNNCNYQRVGETHYEQAYPLEKIKDTLKKVGFSSIEVTSDFGKQQATQNDSRWFFKCEK